MIASLRRIDGGRVRCCLDDEGVSGAQCRARKWFEAAVAENGSRDCRVGALTHSEIGKQCPVGSDAALQFIDPTLGNVDVPAGSLVL